MNNFHAIQIFNMLSVKTREAKLEVLYSFIKQRLSDWQKS